MLYCGVIPFLLRNDLPFWFARPRDMETTYSVDPDAEVLTPLASVNNMEVHSIESGGVVQMRGRLNGPDVELSVEGTSVIRHMHLINYWN